MSKFETAFGKWVVKHRWWIIVATLLVVFAAVNGTQYLTVNNDNRVFFSKDNPQLKALEALENIYTKSNNLLIVVAPKDGDIFSRTTLAAIEELTENSWQVPYSSRVNSITNFQHTETSGDDLIVRDLVSDADNLTDVELHHIREVALTEPEVLNYLTSPTGHVAGVSINIMLPGKSPDEVVEIAFFARQMADNFRETYPDIELYLAGGVMIDNAFGEVFARDMGTLVPLMFLVLVLVVGLALRAVTGTIGTLLVIILSSMTAMGLAGWLGITMTSASANAPTIILVLAVADSVHILATAFQQMRRGKEKREAIAESLRINLQPVLLTSLTTAIGFMTMNFSDAPPFRDLGNIVAMGVMAAFFYSVLFLPALMAVLPLKVRARAGYSNRTVWKRLADFVIQKRRILFWGTAALIVLFTIGITRIDFQDDWIKYFDKSYEIRHANDFAEANLTGLNIVEYSLDAGGSGEISDPKYLANLDRFTEWYRQQPGVVYVNSLANTMKRLNRTMHNNDESYYRIPEQRDLAAQYLLLYEMSLPFGFDLNDQINVDKSSTRMIAYVRGLSTTQLRDLERRGQEWLSGNVPPEMYTQGSGLSIVWAHLSERNINSMCGAALGALVLISFLMIFALRSLKLGLLSLIPNLTPACVGFGLWGWMVGEVGLGLSVVAAMTLGIVIDDTVHFLSKYLRARREHRYSPVDAIRYSFNTVGAAMWITTLTLVAGFLVLSFSGFKMNSDMGLLTAITVTLALGLDFFFLPALLLRAEAKTIKQISLTKEKTNETVNPNFGTVPVSIDNSRLNSDS